MPPHTIAVSSSSIGEKRELEQLAQGRASIVVGSVATPADVARLTEGADAIIVALQPLTGAHIDAFGERCDVIGRAGVGLDTIDLEAAAARPATVIHEPGYSTGEVADHAAALLLALCRRVVASDRAMERAGWAGVDAIGHFPDLRASTLGVVGAGRIGSALIERMRPFVARIVAFDPFAAALPDGVERAESLEALLRTSSLVSLHAPLLPDTRHLIGRAELELLPPGAMLVNVSRGGLVDEEALAEALASGRLGGVGLDAFAIEPLPADSPLRRVPNAVLTPHVAGHSAASAERLTAWMLADVLAHLDDEELPHGRYAVAPSRPNRNGGGQ
jgi:D-3-phosphoglycerate dehydrogenase